MIRTHKTIKAPALVEMVAKDSNLSAAARRVGMQPRNLRRMLRDRGLRVLQRHPVLIIQGRA